MTQILEEKEKPKDKQYIMHYSHYEILKENKKYLEEEHDKMLAEARAIVQRISANQLSMPRLGNRSTFEVSHFESIPRTGQESGLRISNVWNMVKNVGESLELDEMSFKMAFQSRLSGDHLRVWQDYCHLPLQEAVKSLVDHFDNPSSRFDCSNNHFE